MMTIREQSTETLLEWLEILEQPRGMNKRVKQAHDVKVRAIKLVLRERGIDTAETR